MIFANVFSQMAKKIKRCFDLRSFLKQLNV